MNKMMVLLITTLCLSHVQAHELKKAGPKTQEVREVRIIEPEITSTKKFSRLVKSTMDLLSPAIEFSQLEVASEKN